MLVVHAGRRWSEWCAELAATPTMCGESQPDPLGLVSQLVLGQVCDLGAEHTTGLEHFTKACEG